MKVNDQFWKTRGGSTSVQGGKVSSLRKMGFTGSLNGMSRDFYRNITGIDDLTTAKSRAEGVADVSGVFNYVGKANGDGDASRLLKYGANANEMAPSGFTSEAVSGYAGVAADNGTPGYYEVTTPSGAYVQFCFTLNLSQFGTRADLLKKVKSMKVRVKTHDATVKVWNPTESRYDLAKVGTTAAAYSYVEIDLLDKLNDLIGSDNKVSVLVRTNSKTNGTTPLRLEVDYFEIAYSFFK